MKRREFLKYAGTGALGLATTSLVGCGSDGEETAAAPESAAAGASNAEIQEAAQADSALPTLNWDMATSWPISLDTIFGGAQVFAERVTALTGGKLTINARAAGELAGGTEVLDVVEQGSVIAGHTASYYYVGKSNATAFGTALPFGMTARQQNAWLYEGGGLDLMQQFYADRFNVIQFPAGNTGVQMGGWFNKEINSVNDLPGLKMRIPGLGGRVMDRLGVIVQVLPGGEIYQALDTGAIDAAEWVGPYDDQKLGFEKVAKFYYYPGWWEPGPSLEVQINLDEWKNLPQIYQEAIKSAAFEANTIMMARYDAKNPAAIEQLMQADIQVLPFPDDVLRASEEAAFALYDEYSQEDADFKAIFEQWKPYRNSVASWHGLAETRMLSYLASSEL